MTNKKEIKKWIMEKIKNNKGKLLGGALFAAGFATGRKVTINQFNSGMSNILLCNPGFEEKFQQAIDVTDEALKK